MPVQLQVGTAGELRQPAWHSPDTPAEVFGSHRVVEDDQGLWRLRSERIATVRTIGVVDIVLSIAMAAMLFGVVRGRGKFHALAYSPIAIGVYAWAVLWGFLTAASRMTAAGVFFPEVWDLVERAPNFMIPAALLYLVVSYRKTHPEAPVFVPEEFKSKSETPQELAPH